MGISLFSYTCSGSTPATPMYFVVASVYILWYIVVFVSCSIPGLRICNRDSYLRQMSDKQFNQIWSRRRNYAVVLKKGREFMEVGTRKEIDNADENLINFEHGNIHRYRAF